MELRTMQQLETDIIRNTIADKARFCRLAIEAGHASDAAAFARGAVRAARQLGEQNASEQQAERVAEPSLKLTTPGPVITIEPTERGYRLRLPDKCAPCAGAIGGFKAMRWMAYHDSQRGAYRSFPKDKLAEVQDFLWYWFVEASNDGLNRNGDKPATVRVIEIDQNAAATVRWSNGDYADAAIAAGGTLTIRKVA